VTRCIETGADPRKVASVCAPALLALTLLAPAVSRAEPYLAVRSGAKCMACHVNPTGGGKRTEFGNIYSQTTLAEERLDPATGKPASGSESGSLPALWTGKINDHFAVGGDLRATAQGTIVPNSASTSAFDQTRAQLYLELKPIV
jgi:hypothetical protein